MTITLNSLNSNIQTWAQTASTADVSVALSDGGPRTLTGMAAAAYLFGQALTTVKYQDTLDGVQLSDCRFQFPPAAAPTSGPDTRQWVTLSEVADALRYKYGVDPFIEFAPGLGVRGYSVPDINRTLEALNREFSDQFKFRLISTEDVLKGVLLSISGGTRINSINQTYDYFSLNLPNPDPNWPSGTRVRVNSNDFGFTAGVDYFIRNLGPFGDGIVSYQLYDTADHARASSNGLALTVPGRIDITGYAKGVQITLADTPEVVAATALLNTASTPILAPATESELRQNLTEGGDLYTDRFGAFYLKGVRTQAMDVAVTSRLLVQDNVSAEYKTLMDELAERNNLIAAAREVIGQIGSSSAKGLAERNASLLSKVKSLESQYGDDILTALTAGAFQHLRITSTQASELLWNGTSSPAAELTAAELEQITALLNTLISNKVRDGDLDQAKLQTLTAQLQNNTEAMTALIKAFTDMNAQLARAL